MGMGAAAGGAEGGAASGSVMGAGADVGGYGGGVGATAGAAGSGTGLAASGSTLESGALMSSLQSALSTMGDYFKNPENLKALGKALMDDAQATKSGGSSQAEMRRMFQEMAANQRSAQLGGQKSSGENRPNLGGLEPSGSYKGDIANYQIDPSMARSVLSQMGQGPRM